MWQHRFAFNDNRLNSKNTKQNEYDQYQKDIANQPHSLSPEKSSGLPTVVMYRNIEIVRRVKRAKGNRTFSVTAKHKYSVGFRTAGKWLTALGTFDFLPRTKICQRVLFLGRVKSIP